MTEVSPAQAGAHTHDLRWHDRAPRRWRRPRLAGQFGVLAGLGLARPGDASAIREGGSLAEVDRRERMQRRLLAGADVVAAGLAMLACLPLIEGGSLRPWAILAVPLVILASKLVGLYDRDELLINQATLDEAPRLLQLATLYTLLVAVLQPAFVRGELHPTTILALWVAMFAFALLARGSARSLARALSPSERVLFVGTDDAAARLRAKFATFGDRVVLVGQMSIGELERPDGASAAAVLRRLVDDLRVHRVVIEPSEPHPQTTLDFVREAKGTGARVSILPRILEVVGSSIEVDDVHGLTLLGVRRFGLSRSSALVKRGFDLLGAGIGLIVLAPVFGLIALTIRFDSGGPVFYRQIRIGRDGRPFAIWKFRTMVEGADAMKASLRDLNEADGLFKIAADPRITRVGGWLRRRSLDELPQLVNVVRGEMSLVGPRPLVPDDDHRITGLDRRRLELTPGMTGQWQILGSARVPLQEMIKLDYLYVTGWSLWSDVKILLRTVPYVLARRGL